MSSNRNLDILLRVTVQLVLLSGTNCIENVAQHKLAQQKSTWFHKDPHYSTSAGFAVDGKGRDNTKPEEGCASTADGTDKDAWWMVNLQRLYVIVNITVLGRENSYERLRDFYIRVGNSSNITQHVYCTYKAGWVEHRVGETFKCNSTLVGSWVSLQRTNDKGFNDEGGHGWLQLCEVQVFGFENRTCRHKEFGLGCQNVCHCANNRDCDKETGVCPEGACDEGYGANTCNIKLPKLYWRNENTAIPVDNTNHVRIVFYQFKRGTYAYLDSGEGPVGEYTVDVKEDGSNDWAPIATFKHDDTKDRLEVTVTGLKFYKEYTMRVVPWYQGEGHVKFRGIAKRTFAVRTSCGDPDKPVITYLATKRVIGGANVTVMFMMSQDGHNCRRYKKVDIKRRLLGTLYAPWTLYEWFHLEERRVQVFINASDMTKTHEIRVKVYNDENKWTESDIKIFTPVTVSPTSMAWTPYPSNTMPSTTRRSDNVSKAYTQCPTQDMLATSPSVNDTSALKTGIIAASVILMVFLIIIIALLVYVWRLKQSAKMHPSAETGMRDVKRKHVTGSQDENIRTDLPGMDGEYESVGLSPVERDSYVNVLGNKYQTLDKQQIMQPSPKTYAKLGRL